MINSKQIYYQRINPLRLAISEIKFSSVAQNSLAYTNETHAENILKKFYVALINAFKLQAKIERIIKKYNLIALYNAEVRNELKKLSLKLNEVVCKINFLKAELNNFKY